MKEKEEKSFFGEENFGESFTPKWVVKWKKCEMWLKLFDKEQKFKQKVSKGVKKVEEKRICVCIGAFYYLHAFEGKNWLKIKILRI